MVFFLKKTLKLLSFYQSAAILSDNWMTIVILVRESPALPVPAARLLCMRRSPPGICQKGMLKRLPLAWK
jgi:hypothetical protein